MFFQKKIVPIKIIIIKEMSLLVSYSGCFMCDFYLYLFCKRESVKLEGSNFVFILLLCLRSKRF